MSKKSTLVIATLIFYPILLTACGGGGGSTGGSGGVKRFVAACTSQTNMGDELCSCVANKAQKDLSKDGFAMLLATLEEDRATADKLRRSMKIEEVTQAGMFMATGPAACARG